MKAQHIKICEINESVLRGKSVALRKVYLKKIITV